MWKKTERRTILRIIDPHVHVWKNDPAFPWPVENESPPTEDRSAEMLLESMAANGVEKTVLVQTIYYRWDNSYVAHVIRQYPDKFMAVGRINPRGPRGGGPPEHVDGGARSPRHEAESVATSCRGLVCRALDGSDLLREPRNWAYPCCS